MNEKSSENDNGLVIKVSDKIPSLKESAGVDMGIVATVTTAVATVRVGFPEKTSSGFIIQNSFEASGKKWTLKEARFRTEEYERARGIRDGGYNFTVGGSVEGGEVKLEKKPVWEIKRMVDLTYKIEDKSN